METQTTQQAIAVEILTDLIDQLQTSMVKDRFCLTDHGLAVFIERLKLANSLLDG